MITAGPKLRSQAIERTRRHIERQRKGHTQLSSVINMKTEGLSASEYIRAERARLARLESL